MTLYRVSILTDDLTLAARAVTEHLPGARVREMRHYNPSGVEQIMVSFIREEETSSDWGVTDTDRMLVTWLRKCLEHGDLPCLLEWTVYEKGAVRWPKRG